MAFPHGKSWGSSIATPIHQKNAALGVPNHSDLIRGRIWCHGSLSLFLCLWCGVHPPRLTQEAELSANERADEGDPTVWLELGCSKIKAYIQAFPGFKQFLFLPLLVTGDDDSIRRAYFLNGWLNHERYRFKLNKDD